MSSSPMRYASSSSSSSHFRCFRRYHSSSNSWFFFLRRLLSRRHSILVLLIVVNVVVLIWLYGVNRQPASQRRRRVEEDDDDNDLDAQDEASNHHRDNTVKSPSAPEVTIVVREFEDFDNAVSTTVASVLHLLPGAPVVVVADKFPYPPIAIPSNAHSVKIVTLDKAPGDSYLANHLERIITTPYVLILPDGAMITRRDHVQNFLVGTLKRRRSSTVVDAIAIGLSSHSAESLTCVNVSFVPHLWTLIKVGGSGAPLSHPHDCRGGAVGEDDGAVAIFIRTESLWNLSHPFARPFPHSFYVQSSLRGIVIRLETRFRFGVSRPLFSDAHNRWKHKTLERERKKELYKRLGIKKVVHQTHPSSSSSDAFPSTPAAAIEWFGCTRESSRCFGSVPEGENPAYVNEGRWTPPCCLEKLRETTRHVAKVLEEAKVRHWLEGGSLLGAVRHADIIPWDYDVDFGMYLEDLSLCRPLRQAWDGGAYEDDAGFVWERAREADFFRVQYSRSNRLHVDIFPFYVKNGDEKKSGVIGGNRDESGADGGDMMTKDFWFATHRQDVEFPERFLLPMARIPFVGVEVAAPNNAKEFLELKFGKGVVENPRYPKGASPILPSMAAAELGVVKGKDRPLLHGN